MGIKGFGKITNELREFEPNARVIGVPPRCSTAATAGSSLTSVAA
jgi:hypothetical protein